MICSRCNKNHTGTHSHLCTVCRNQLLKRDLEGTETEHMNEEEIATHHMVRLQFEGCRECGSKTFGYEIGIQEENELLWYVAMINCKDCNNNYKEILEVRIDESNKNSNGTQEN